MTPRHGGPHPALVGFFLLLVYGITASGHFYTSDAGAKLAVARTLVREGRFSLEPDTDLNHIVAPDGRKFVPWAPGMILYMVPAALLESAITGMYNLPQESRAYLAVSIVCLMSAASMALLGVLVHLLAIRLGSSPPVAARLAILIGLTTQVWPFSKTGVAEVPVAVLLMTTALALLWNKNGPDDRHLIIAAFSVSIATLFYYPCVLLVIAVCLARHLLDHPKKSFSSTFFIPAVLVLPAILAILWLNHVRTGSLLNFGYGLDRIHELTFLTAGSLLALGVTALVLRSLSTLDNPVRHVLLTLLLFSLALFLLSRFDSLFVVFLSPGDGILYHSPTLLLLAFSITDAFKTRPGPSRLMCLMSILICIPAHQNLVSTWTFGSRYLFPVVPLVMCLTLPLLERPQEPGLARALMTTLVGLGLFIQICGVTGSTHVFRDRALHRYVAKIGDPHTLSWSDLERQVVLDPIQSSFASQIRRVGELDFSFTGARERGA